MTRSWRWRISADRAIANDNYALLRGSGFRPRRSNVEIWYSCMYAETATRVPFCQFIVSCAVNPGHHICPAPLGQLPPSVLELIYNFIHHKVANSSEKIKQCKIWRERDKIWSNLYCSSIYRSECNDIQSLYLFLNFQFFFSRTLGNSKQKYVWHSWIISMLVVLNNFIKKSDFASRRCSAYITHYYSVVSYRIKMWNVKCRGERNDTRMSSSRVSVIKSCRHSSITRVVMTLSSSIKSLLAGLALITTSDNSWCRNETGSSWPLTIKW